MRAVGGFAVAVVVVLVLHVAVLPVVAPLPVLPDLAVLLVVWLALRHDGVAGPCAAFLVGYLLDTFSGTMLGLNAFAMTVVYAAVLPLARALWTEAGVATVAIVFVAGCLRWLAALLLAVLVEAGPPVWARVAGWGVVEAALGALVSPVVFAALDWEHRQLGVA